MGKFSIYIIQFLGVILLFGAFSINKGLEKEPYVQPGTGQKVQHSFSKGHKSHLSEYLVKKHSEKQQDKTRHKHKVRKASSTHVFIPQKNNELSTAVIITNSSKAVSIPQGYGYLFYKEINPPPPKC